MSSDKKSQANRKNAQLSTGPKTERGKAHSKYNAKTHGFYMGQVLPGENESAYKSLLGDVVAQFDPRGILEIVYVSLIARDIWKLYRVTQAEHDYVTDCVYDYTEAHQMQIGELVSEPTEFIIPSAEDAGKAIVDLVKKGGATGNFEAAIASAKRSLERNLTVLRALQSARLKIAGTVDV